MSEGIRINKFLSEAGVCSRREADRLAEAGKITIDDEIASCGSKVLQGQIVLVEGKRVSKEDELIVIAVNKPVGIVCTAEKKEKNNIVDFIHYPKRIYPVGRLDKDSRGLIFMTNHGDLVNKLMRAKNYHEKEYEVRVDREITDAFIQGMSNGVLLKELSVVTRKCEVNKTGKYTFRIILTQGYNRQIRRMCEYFGYQVKDLLRTRIMNISLKHLNEGGYRKLTKQEIDCLTLLLANSTSEPDVGHGPSNKSKERNKDDRSNKKESNRRTNR